MSRAWYGLLPVFAGLIVVLMGLLLLNAAGLVGYQSGEVAASPTGGPVVADDSAATALSRPAFTAEQRAALAVQVGFQKEEAETALATGDALFKNNCAQCHAVNEVVVGPALAGIGKRRPVSWLVPWVKNSSKVVASGDAYAVALFEKYQKQQMPSFQLSDREVRAILLYVGTQQSAASAPAVAAR